VVDIELKAATVAAAGLGALAALLAGATMAHADPGAPVPPPPPGLIAPVVPAPAPAAPVAAPAPALPGGAAPVAADTATPAEGVPHLVSPENLPPGTSLTPVGPHQSNGGSYLRELWHAVQTQEVSGKDALLLLTQRPLNANATPPPGLAANPQEQVRAAAPPAPGAPLSPVAAPSPPAAPAPAPAPTTP
jgi:resuscitation-promoting factor RpfA